MNPGNNYDPTGPAIPDYDKDLEEDFQGPDMSYENYEENWGEEYDGEYDGEYENYNENEYYEPMAGRETAQTHSERRDSPVGMPIPQIASVGGPLLDQNL